MQDYRPFPEVPGPIPGPPVRKSISPLMFVLVILIALLIMPSVAERVQFALTRGEQRAKAEVAREQLAEMPNAVNRFRLVAQSIEPSVVGIDTVRLVGGRSLGDEWLGFGARGEGSGVIVDEAGYIVTNFHVIARAAEVKVRLSDGRTISNVRIIGADPLTDLAVLKIDAGQLVAAPWGDSDALEVGDEVVAVGNPFGLARTVTAGIVSAKDRRAVTSQGLHEFLQTDAAVNPGNSGGPLLNLKGEVVGINTAIYGRTYQGISFAIPSRLAREVYEKLKTTGQIERGWLGVEMDELTEAAAERLGLRELRGVVVHRVLPDSPAERAGIQVGDVILEWDGQEIGDPLDLRRAVARAKIGSRVDVLLIRHGRERVFTVEVGRRPADFGR